MSLSSKFRQFLQRISKPTYGVGKDNLVSFWTTGVHHVQFGGGNMIPENCAFANRTILGFRTTLGTNNYFGGKVILGKYCQIGRDVAFHPTNHPITHLTTYINRQLFDGELKNLKTEKIIKVGNDVWIGHGVIILAGVEIGDGAILAAGAVVTKNVEPYTIVVGNPAKPIRKRFSDKIIEELLELKWWDLPEAQIQKIKPLFLQNLEEVQSINDFLKPIK